MTINGINGVNTQMKQMGMNQATDSYSRNIQSQIANAKKQLQELSSNEDMSLEEKMKKRQEIQQQISDLNMQLRQHQMEQRKEKQQAKHKPGKFFLGQFLQLFRCALRKLTYLRFHVGQGGGHCRHRISPCFLPVTADKVYFLKVELSHAFIPPIPCFCSLPPAFSGRLLRFLCPLQAAFARTVFSLFHCRTVFRYAPLCYHNRSDLCYIFRILLSKPIRKMGDDVERKGLGTPATRADVIEKLIS